jgi:hypothetical protein
MDAREEASPGKTSLKRAHPLGRHSESFATADPAACLGGCPAPCRGQIVAMDQRALCPLIQVLKEDVRSRECDPVVLWKTAPAHCCGRGTKRPAALEASAAAQRRCGPVGLLALCPESVAGWPGMVSDRRPSGQCQMFGTPARVLAHSARLRFSPFGQRDRKLHQPLHLPVRRPGWPPFLAPHSTVTLLGRSGEPSRTAAGAARLAAPT